MLTCTVHMWRSKDTNGAVGSFSPSTIRVKERPPTLTPRLDDLVLTCWATGLATATTSWTFTDTEPWWMDHCLKDMSAFPKSLSDSNLFFEKAYPCVHFTVNHKNVLRCGRILLLRLRVETSQCKTLTLIKCKGTKTSQHLILVWNSLTTLSYNALAHSLTTQLIKITCCPFPNGQTYFHTYPRTTEQMLADKMAHPTNLKPFKVSLKATLKSLPQSFVPFRFQPSP